MVVVVLDTHNCPCFWHRSSGIRKRGGGAIGETKQQTDSSLLLVQHYSSRLKWGVVISLFLCAGYFCLFLTKNQVESFANGGEKKQIEKNREISS